MKLKMKNMALLLCLLIAVCSCSSGRVAKEGTSFLWEVKPKSDTSKAIYLLGSIHLAPPELYPLNPVIMSAWQRSTALAVELNLQDTSHQQALLSDLSLVNKLISIGGPKLSDRLPEPLYRRVQKQLNFGMFDSSMIDYLTPLGAAIILELGGFMSTQDSFSLAVSGGIDMHFIELAQSEKKPVFELESLAGQLAAFEALENNIVPYIETLLNKLESAADPLSVQDLFKAWSAGDVALMAEQLSAPMASDPAVDNAIKDAILYKRNAAMASKIEGYLAQAGTYFVVVGAGHYVGARSVIELLQQSGKYNIRRL